MSYIKGMRIVSIRLLMNDSFLGVVGVYIELYAVTCEDGKELLKFVEVEQYKVFSSGFCFGNSQFN